MTRVKRPFAFAAALAFLGLVPSSSAAADRAGTVRIGSKKFTESIILAEIATQLITASDTTGGARHIAELGGTRILWNSLIGDALDAYPEYTGTITQELLRGPDGEPATADGLRAGLARAGLAATASLGFNNSYALGMKDSTAERLGIRRVSDLAGHPELVFGLSNEFQQRIDGWPLLRRSYGLTAGHVRGLDHDIGYRALESGDIDVIDLYSTDAEIDYYHLRVLEDDRAAFPRYDAIFVFRDDLGRRAPGAVAALRRLGGAFDARSMAKLNAQAKLDHVPAPTIARRFLAERFGLSAPDTSTPIVREVLRHLLEHLRLVSISMGLGILVAIPLGILASRRRRAGQVILTAAGIIQTIPALALLVMLIRPMHWLGLPGIGDAPAIVALFLYSLLPMIRNTYAGLQGIPAPIRESAATLGLPSWTQLRLIELPLASPFILAGIRTAAVINVGFATLGALIGAGGFGQPILSGIRLDDYGLILQGAAPAAALAIATQALFGLAERWLVPRGLRLARDD